MTTFGRLTAALGVLCVATGCQDAQDTGTITSTIANTPGFMPGVPPGYHCPIVPNGFDPAASIYRLDKSGTYFRVKDFSQDPKVLAMTGYKRDVPISNYALSDRQLTSAGLSFEVLKNALPGLVTDAKTDFKKDVAVSVVVEDMKGEVIDDEVADYILGWFKANAKPQPGSKYFLVREAVKAGAVSYTLKQEDVAKLGGQAQMEGLAKGNANVTFRDNNGAFEIKQRFQPDRINVCVKSAEIVVASAGANRSAGTVEASLKSPEETSVPAIRKRGASE
jgi:hypothetical protein